MSKKLLNISLGTVTTIDEHRTPTLATSGPVLFKKKPTSKTRSSGHSEIMLAKSYPWEVILLSTDLCSSALLGKVGRFKTAKGARMVV